MTTKKDLEDQIKSKFGKKAHFARVTGIGPYELQKMFALKVMDPAHVKLIKAALKKDNKSKVDQVKLKLLKKAIDDAGGCYQFTKDHPEFPQRLTYMIYNGEQKSESKLFKKLLEYFKIE